MGAREALDPQPVLSVREVKIADHSVIVVEVLKGTLKPCMLISGNEIYVRRGANNMRPTREELASIFSGGEISIGGALE
jgi:predicted HTH transcriptional regulator